MTPKSPRPNYNCTVITVKFKKKLTGGGVDGGVGSGGGVLGGDETGESPNSGSSHNSVLGLRSDMAELIKDSLLGVEDGEQ